MPPPKVRLLRAVLGILLWLLAGGSLYLTMALLEAHWNLVSWKPVLDWIALLLLLLLTGTQLGFVRLSCAQARRPAKEISLLFCLALLVLGIYLLPREPLTEGLFARNIPSPAWYRIGRLLVMAAPTVLWLRSLRKRTMTH